MSLALFRSELRSAVRDAHAADDAGVPRAEPLILTRAAERALLLRRLAGGEVSIEEALEALGEAP